METQEVCYVKKFYKINIGITRSVYSQYEYYEYQVYDKMTLYNVKIIFSVLKKALLTAIVF